MRDPDDQTQGMFPLTPEPSDDDVDSEALLTSAADVDSAGRSCLVILIMVAIIVVLLALWVIFGVTGAGRWH